MVAREDVVEITVNGERREYAAPLSVGELLKSLGIDPRAVVVECNLEILARESMEIHSLRAGDTIEIIRFMGGG